MKRHGDRPYLFNASRRARCPHRAAIPYAPSSARPRKLRIIRHGINAMAYSLRCSSSPQRDRWRWVTLGAPNGHLPPWVGKACWAAFYRLPPSGGKLLSEAKLMRGLTIERRADDIRPYTENVHDPRRGRRPRRPAGPSNTPRRGRSMYASWAAEDIRPYIVVACAVSLASA